MKKPILYVTIDDRGNPVNYPSVTQLQNANTVVMVSADKNFTLTFCHVPDFVVAFRRNIELFMYWKKKYDLERRKRKLTR